MIELRGITPESFARYGRVLVWDPAVGSRLQQVSEEQGGAPWLLATYRLAAHEVDHLAEHPDSVQMVAPLAGTAVLLVAVPEAPERYEAFLLDVPVVIDRGIWHGLCALSEAAILALAMNTNFGGTRRPLEPPLQFRLAPGA